MHLLRSTGFAFLGARRRALGLTLLLATSVAACGGGGGEQTARDRGDLAFARDSLDEALAEYRLAVRQGSDDAAVLARVAHTYAVMGRVDEAEDFYRDAIDRDGSLSDQAVADLVFVARNAAARGDDFLMASAMTAATEIRPGISVEELALPLARHYFESGQYGRALPFYQKALSTPDSTPRLVFEIGQAYEEIGDCELGLEYFEAYRELVRPWERAEVDWYVGSCAFNLARDRFAQAEEIPHTDLDRRLIERLGFGSRASDRSRGVTLTRGDGEEADTVADFGGVPPDSRVGLLLEARTFVDRAIAMGEPRNIMSQAWFERGEILATLGDCEGAIDSFDEVRNFEPSESTALARRARIRYDELRFGRGLARFRSEGPCG